MKKPLELQRNQLFLVNIYDLQKFIRQESSEININEIFENTSMNF